MGAEPGDIPMTLRLLDADGAQVGEDWLLVRTLVGTNGSSIVFALLSEMCTARDRPGPTC